MDYSIAVPSKLGASAVASGAHTPEPWSIHHQASTAINGSKGWVVATCGGHSDNRRDADELFSELTANARRIVACVNACAGLGTELLEHAAPEGVGRAFMKFDDLKTQRDELAEALRGLEACYCEVGTNLSSAQRNRHRKALITARAALAKLDTGTDVDLVKDE